MKAEAGGKEGRGRPLLRRSKREEDLMNLVQCGAGAKRER